MGSSLVFSQQSATVVNYFTSYLIESDFAVGKKICLDFLNKTSVTRTHWPYSLHCGWKLQESAGNTEVFQTAHTFRSIEVMGSWSQVLVNVLEANISFLHTGYLSTGRPKAGHYERDLTLIDRHIVWPLSMVLCGTEALPSLCPCVCECVA